MVNMGVRLTERSTATAWDRLSRVLRLFGRADIWQ